MWNTYNQKPNWHLKKIWQQAGVALLASDVYNLHKKQNIVSITSGAHAWEVQYMTLSREYSWYIPSSKTHDYSSKKTPSTTQFEWNM